jgi:L-lysine exporter family protein LysE/ArgO
MTPAQFAQAAPTLLHGFLLYAGMVIVIGPQNLFVLRQGLGRRHLFVTALLCTVADLFLIAVSVSGLGAAVAANQVLATVSTLAGVAFLSCCGMRALRTAWGRRGAVASEPAHTTALTLKGTMLAALGFTFLNPAAYVDTLLAVGTASGQYPLDERMVFGAGAVLAAGIWFFALTYGASRFTDLLRHPRAWQSLDVVSGCVMLGMAGALYVSQMA